MHPIYQLIKIDTWIIYYYKDCDNTFKESEHIHRQFLQSFDFTLRDTSFIFGMCDPYDKTFPTVP